MLKLHVSALKYSKEFTKLASNLQNAVQQSKLNKRADRQSKECEPGNALDQLSLTSQVSPTNVVNSSETLGTEVTSVTD